MKTTTKAFAFSLTTFLLVIAMSVTAQVAAEGGVELSKDEIRKHFKELRSRHQVVRERALDALVDADADLKPYLKRELASKRPSRLKGAMKIAQLRLEYAELIPLVDFLSSKDASLVAEARHLLRAWGYDAVTQVDQAMRDDANLNEKMREVFDYEARYAASSAIIAVASAPGYFDGQYDALLSQGQWAVTALADIAELNAGVADPMKEAVLDLAERANDIEEISYGFARLLKNCKGIPLAVAAMRGERQWPTNAKALQYASDVVIRMRKRAVQALGEASAKEAALEALKRTYKKVKSAKEGVRTLALVDTSLGEEVEISLSRLGEPAYINARIANLRLTVSTPANNGDIGDVNSPAAVGKVGLLDGDDLDPDVRKKISYLLLRSGRYEAAVKEYTLLLQQLERSPNEFFGDNGVAAYNLACAQTRSGKLDDALKSLKKAVAYGYDSYTHYRWMLLDGDLKELREKPEFVTWFEDVAPPYLARLLKNAQADGELEPSDEESDVADKAPQNSTRDE